MNLFKCSSGIDLSKIGEWLDQLNNQTQYTFATHPTLEIGKTYIVIFTCGSSYEQTFYVINQEIIGSVNIKTPNKSSWGYKPMAPNFTIFKAITDTLGFSTSPTTTAYVSDSDSIFKFVKID